MSAGQLRVVRVLAPNPKPKKKKRRAKRRPGRRPKRNEANGGPREMVMAICGNGLKAHYQWWTGSGWARQKSKGKKYRYREDLNAAWKAGIKKPPRGGTAVLTVPA